MGSELDFREILTVEFLTCPTLPPSRKKFYNSYTTSDKKLPRELEALQIGPQRGPTVVANNEADLQIWNEGPFPLTPGSLAAMQEVHLPFLSRVSLA